MVITLVTADFKLIQPRVMRRGAAARFGPLVHLRSGLLLRARPRSAALARIFVEDCFQLRVLHTFSCLFETLLTVFSVSIKLSIIFVLLFHTNLVACRVCPRASSFL